MGKTLGRVIAIMLALVMCFGTVTAFAEETDMEANVEEYTEAMYADPEVFEESEIIEETEIFEEPEIIEETEIFEELEIIEESEIFEEPELPQEEAETYEDTLDPVEEIMEEELDPLFPVEEPEEEETIRSGLEFEDAQGIALNTATMAYIETAGQVVWFCFVPSASGTYRFLSFSGVADDDPYGYLADENGAVLLEDDQSASYSDNNFEISCTLQAGATYYLGVKWDDPTITGQIPVMVTDIGYEPDLVGAENIELDVLTQAIVQAPNQIVVFRFVPVESGDYVFSSHTRDDLMGTYGYLFNESGETLWSRDGSGEFGNVELACSLEAGETYYWGIKWYSVTKIGAIPVRLARSGGGGDDTDPDFDNAPDITLDELTTVSVGAGETVWFRFIPSETGSYTFTSSSDGDTYGNLADENGETIEESDDDGDGSNFRLICDLEAGSTYYFGVRWYDPEETGNIPVLLTKGGGDDTDPDFDNGPDITLDELTTVSVGAGETVWFRFIPSETGSYTFTSSSDGDTVGYLADENGETIEESDDDGDGSNFRLVCDLEAGSTYYFGVRWYDPEETGDIPVLLTKDDGGGIASGTCGDNVIWTWENGVLTISGNGAMDDYSSPFGTPYRQYSYNTVIIEEGVTHIGNLAFYWVFGLENVVLSNGLISIGDNAFGDSEQITGITIPDGVTSIGSGAFNNCHRITSLEIPASVIHIGEKAFGSCELDHITVDPQNPVYDSRNNCNALIETATNTLKAGSNHTVIPSEITAIEPLAFSWRRGLTNADLPAGIKTIGEWTFSSCDSLESIVIPDGVTSIGSTAFIYCYNLKEAVIPSSVTVIGDRAFELCTGLTDVYYKGSEEDWALITIGSDNECLTGANIHYINVPKNGWNEEDGKWYYYKDYTRMTGWQKISNKWYYLGTDGAMKTGWVKVSGKWYYMNSSGVMQTGWVKVSSKWYYMNSGGVMLTGWQEISGKKYYLGTDGVMKTGWQKISNKWYYLGTSGVMTTGWQKISNKWYYLGTDGVMTTGWQKISKKWYYLGTDGVMTTGWKKISSKWYYFNSSGVMLTGTQTIDGKSYTFDSSGVWTGK